MKIETELTIDDDIYFINEGVISKGKVESIDIKIINSSKGVATPKQASPSIVYNISTKSGIIASRIERIIGKTQEDLFNKIKLEK